MNITNGKILRAQKICIYGVEGIGKSTFASQFPDVLFSDTEGSTSHMDVKRFEKPSSWTMLMEQINYIKTNKICTTYCIDTIDWAEQLCIEFICSKHNKTGIEDFGYGNGYVYVKEEFGRFLNKLQELIDIGINVVLTAHAQIRKFEQPDEMGAYDRYELKLGKKTSSQTAPLVKEWADMVLFARYKTVSVAVDDKGKKNKAQGGKRVMHTEHHPCWDAKNRHGLPAELPFEYSAIAHCIPVIGQTTAQAVTQQPVQQVQPAPTIQQPVQQPVQTTAPAKTIKPGVDIRVPVALADLMEQNNVTELEVQQAVASRGYYPADTPIWNYDDNFINGVLVGAWEKVFGMILANRK